HWALSELLAAPARAKLPECTGLPTTEPRPPLHAQPDSVPVSNPGLVSRFAAWAGTVATRIPAAVTAAVNAAAPRAANRCLVRLMSVPPGQARARWTRRER